MESQSPRVVPAAGDRRPERRRSQATVCSRLYHFFADAASLNFTAQAPSLASCSTASAASCSSFDCDDRFTVSSRGNTSRSGPRGTDKRPQDEWPWRGTEPSAEPWHNMQSYKAGGEWKDTNRQKKMKRTMSNASRGLEEAMVEAGEPSNSHGSRRGSQLPSQKEDFDRDIDAILRGGP